MTPDLWIALALGLLTFLGTVGGGAFALLRWLLTTLNGAYREKVDATLTVKNEEIDLLRDDNARLRDELAQCRARPEEAHG